MPAQEIQAAPQAAPIDRYVVMEYLAEGGMGAIYLGKKLGAGGFEKQVVLKQLLPEFTQQPEFIDLFLREARLSATLDHVNIIHTIDLVTAGDEHFIVMEYLDGADLRTLLKKSKLRGKRISAAAGIYVAKELLSALAYAHNKVGPDGKPLRLIHRDISPSNVLISGNGEVKLTDFGIAKAATHNSVFYRVKGKVGYMSPEQAGSESMDARSDLYSMAVCLYEMITGERLLVSSGLTTSVEELYSRPIAPLSEKVAGLPAELDKVMLRALSTNPAERYQTAAEFQEVLLRCAHRHGLMMSAPELAVHLHSVCGTPERWREEEESHDTPSDGTELYDEENSVLDEGTQQLDFSELEEPNGAINNDFLAVDSGFVNPTAKRRERAKTSLTLLENLQGIELTSLAALGRGSTEGAKPLVDLDNYGPPAEKEYSEPYQSTSDVLSAVPQVASAYSGMVGSGAVAADGQYGAIRQSAREYEAQKPITVTTAVEGVGPKPWLLLLLLLVLGVAIAGIVGLTGPTLDLGEPTTKELSTPA